MPGYEVDCGIYHNKITVAVVIEDLTLLIVPHPIIRQWLTLLGFLVAAIIILLVVGSGTHKFHLLMLLYGCLCHYYVACIKIV